MVGLSRAGELRPDRGCHDRTAGTHQRKVVWLAPNGGSSNKPLAYSRLFGRDPDATHTGLRTCGSFRVFAPPSIASSGGASARHSNNLSWVTPTPRTLHTHDLRELGSRRGT